MEYTWHQEEMLGFKMKNENSTPTPFLKWAGGKRSLLKEIIPRIPVILGNYMEPFLGAGAVLFTIDPRVPKVVSDQNELLMETYAVVRDSPQELIDELRLHRNEKEYFLRVRELDRSADFLAMDSVTRAARFIYLNKTCFNGLYRVNSRGQFNVPFGNQKNPDIISERQIRAASSFLNGLDSDGGATRFVVGDYSLLTQSATVGDFVYIDPPYDPVSKTANFVTYGRFGFTADDQLALRNEVDRLTELGVKVMLSNSNTEMIRDLFSSRQYTKELVESRRAIGASPSSRRSVGELLITNYFHSQGK